MSLSISYQFSTSNKACLERQYPLTKKKTAGLLGVFLPYLTHACELLHLQIPTALQHFDLGSSVILKFLKTDTSNVGRCRERHQLLRGKSLPLLLYFFCFGV